MCCCNVTTVAICVCCLYSHMGNGFTKCVEFKLKINQSINQSIMLKNHYTLNKYLDITNNSVGKNVSSTIFPLTHIM